MLAGAQQPRLPCSDAWAYCRLCALVCYRIVSATPFEFRIDSSYVGWLHLAIRTVERAVCWACASVYNAVGSRGGDGGSRRTSCSLPYAPRRRPTLIRSNTFNIIFRQRCHWRDLSLPIPSHQESTLDTFKQRSYDPPKIRRCAQTATAGRRDQGCV